jgi:uncharacterized protein DUF5372
VGAPSSVTITHPHHPLRGQTLELVRPPRRPNSKLTLRHPEGRKVSVPRDWTDYEARQQGEPPLTTPLEQLLDVRGLHELAGMVRFLKAEISSPEGDGGKNP